MRTGSTVLSEALSCPPVSYIFNEPHIGKNSFRLHQYDVEQMRRYGIDLERFVERRKRQAFLLRRLRWTGFPQDYMAREFRLNLMPEVFKQIGVKEVRNGGWQNYLKQFPSVKVIITGRDPRDIYISAYYKLQHDGLLTNQMEFAPASLAHALNTEFELQKQIMKHADHIAVRYEDFCRSSEEIEHILRFVESPLHSSGEIGAYLSSHDLRHRENEKHGGVLSEKSVARYLVEENEQVVEDAYTLMNLMPDYMSFWNYS